ncbi:superoxide dismutase [Pseudomonas aeruginosa]|uniref:Fe-Mn family superoxide dismutase n=1 Tax=Gammaproteobacteria TaxID=1236 RepID=UPI0006FBF6C7|nr:MULTISPECIES: Fe-Mn family superoxide dismutase [Gammaproteobacteria]KQN98356.1 superoxide dismutase [Stenotrophomonas sp. Leaf70]RPS27332.1 superoxide dismutase [Pseudomonas aeruginosa]
MDLQSRPLTIDPAALNGLSEKLIVSHHANNYTGAVKRMNAIRQQLSQLDWPSTPVFTINGLKREELIAANSAWLHELYFDGLGGDGVLPDAGLAVALARDFGSVERWRAEFTALAKAMGGGSGWALLSWSAREARLVTHWAADHTHLLAGATPLLALDMYEHAYHMDFGAKAAAYVDAFMQNIRWDAVMRRFGAALEADARPWAADPAEVRGGAQIVDVRRAANYAQSADRIAGAVWRDPVALEAWSRELDSTRPVLVYCVHGHEVSRAAALALRARGLDARFIAGGIEACRAAGIALEVKE